MLNRYGLIDIDKILREQLEPPPPDGGPLPPQGGGDGSPSDPPPDAPPAESSDEKLKKQKDTARDEDLVAFRRKHGDAIYRVVQAYKNYRKADTGARAYPDPSVDSRYSFNTQNQSLKSKFEDEGGGSPYMAAFDQETTGLQGDMHIRFLAAIHGGRAGGRGRLGFHSPGAASEFAEIAGQLRPDLAFEVQRGDPRFVGYTNQTEQDEVPEPPSSPQSQQPVA